MTTLQIKNYYRYIPVEGTGIRKYKNWDKLRINIPMRMLIVGCSGSGKTNVCLNIISLMSCFSQIFLFAKNLDEPLYQFLIKKMEKLGRKVGKQLIFYSNDIDELPSVDDIDKDENTLMVFDDLVSLPAKAQKPII